MSVLVQQLLSVQSSACSQQTVHDEMLLLSNDCSARGRQQHSGLLQITTAAYQCCDLLLARVAPHLRTSAEGGITTAAWPRLCERRLSSIHLHLMLQC